MKKIREKSEQYSSYACRTENEIPREKLKAELTMKIVELLNNETDDGIKFEAMSIAASLMFGSQYSLRER